MGCAMKPPLPLLEPHERAHTYCAFCPKLCRFACPVSTEEGRETTTPWAKMTSLHHVAEGNLPLEQSYAKTWYACSGCLRCRTFCEHESEVATALAAGRAEAVRHSAAPAEALAVLQDNSRREAKATKAARALFGRALEERESVVYYPGSTACVVRPTDALAGYEITRALVGPARVEAESFCSLPLLDAGDPEGFLKAASRLVEKLWGSTAILFLDPGCTYAMKVAAPALGLEHDLPIRHLSELVADHLPLLSPHALEGEVRYHDACKLGRGLGIYDAPRLALQKILGRPVDELPQCRDKAECSGAGGQLPRTHAETSEAVARRRLLDHREAGGGLLISACPGSVHHLSRPAVGARPGEVDGFATVIARALRR